MRKTISQTEARRLQKRVGQLEDLVAGERRRYSGEYHGGTHVATIHAPDEALRAIVQTARVLGHVVMVTTNAGEIRFYALPHPKVPV